MTAARVAQRLVEAFQRGTLGVRGVLPAGARVVRDDGEFAELRAPGLMLYLSFSPNRLVMDPRHDELLRQDIERCARELFDLMWSSRPQLPGAVPRTADPAWSPVASWAIHGEHRVLEVVHRMLYQADGEIVLGHLSIPLPSGCLELRVSTGAKVTGLREARLMDELLGTHGLGAGGRPPPLTQAAIDDPLRDGEFPEDPLTIARATLTALRASLTIDGASAIWRDELTLPVFGCALAPPPRYALIEANGAVARFGRLSFSNTDGLLVLTVARMPAKRTGADQLAVIAAREGTSPLQLTELPDGVEGVQTVKSDGAPRHAVYVTYAHDDERWFFIITAPQSHPLSELRADIARTRASLRPLPR